MKKMSKNIMGIIIKFIIFIILLLPVIPVLYVFHFCGYMGIISYGLFWVVTFNIIIVILNIIFAAIITIYGKSLFFTVFKWIIFNKTGRMALILIFTTFLYVFSIFIICWGRLNNAITIVLPENNDLRSKVINILDTKNAIHQPKGYSIGCYPCILLPSPIINKDRVIIYRKPKILKNVKEALYNINLYPMIVSDLPEVWIIRSQTNKCNKLDSDLSASNL